MATAPCSTWLAAAISMSIICLPSLQKNTSMRLLNFKAMRDKILKIGLLSCLLMASGMMEAKAEDRISEGMMADSEEKKTGMLADSEDTDSLTRYDRRILRYRRHWDVLMPTQSVIQTCGNMGIISVGIGWDYGKRRQWETHLLFGIIPKYDSDAVKCTITLKENFIPWRKDWGKGWEFEPLECTLYLNTVLGHDFWTKQPTKYESGYYPFSTRVRPNVGFGERFTYHIPNSRRKRVKSITMFYELSTNDIYFMRFYRNGNANFWDVFGLSLGAKLQIL